MKKNNFKNSIFIIFLIICVSCTNSNMKNENIAESKAKIETKEIKMDTTIAFINSFYKDYISVILEFPVNETKKNNVIKRYCSSRLINTLDTLELDYDPFINAQDIDNKSTNIKIDKLKNVRNGFIIYFGDNKANFVKIHINNENEKLIIDSIEDMY